MRPTSRPLHKAGWPHGRSSLAWVITVVGVLAGCASTANKEGQDAKTSVLASGRSTVASLVSDGTRIFWLEIDNPSGSVFSTGISGGPIRTLSKKRLGRGSLILSSDSVFWFDEAGINRALKEGDGEVTLVIRASRVAAITVDENHYYWAENGTDLSMVVKSATIGNPTDVATLGSALSGRAPEFIATDGSSVFVGAGSLWRMPIMGGSLERVASVNGIVAITVQREAYFWTQGAPGTINRTTVDGASTTELALAPSPSGIELDESMVYWTDAVGVHKIPRQGGVPTDVGTSQNAQRAAVSVDSSSVYWADASGTIYRAPK